MWAPRLAIGTSLSIIAVISMGGIIRQLQFGALDSQMDALVLIGSAAGLFLGARLGTLVSPRTAARIGGSLTIGVALALIVVNTARLVGVS